ncbi:MAG: DUF805 domain-containing protein [Pseudomonadota bacterium]
MDWKFLFTDFEGRIGRKGFWTGFGVLLILYFLCTVLLQPAIALISVAILYPWFAIAVKRCHDRGKSGWWSLLSLIPGLGFLWVVIDLGILEGVRGDNEYGRDPFGGPSASI